MPSDTPARCEPPEALRKVDGWHYLDLGITRWLPDEPGNRATWITSVQKISPEEMWLIGGRYLSPVPSPSEIAALVRAGRAVVQFVAHYPELKTPATDALAVAITAPSFKEIGDGE